MSEMGAALSLCECFRRSPKKRLPFKISLAAFTPKVMKRMEEASMTPPWEEMTIVAPPPALQSIPDSTLPLETRLMERVILRFILWEELERRAPRPSSSDSFFSVSLTRQPRLGSR